MCLSVKYEIGYFEYNISQIFYGKLLNNETVGTYLRYGGKIQQ